MARPRKPDSQVRAVKVPIQCTLDEADEIAYRAEIAGLAVADFVRAQALAERSARLTTEARQRLREHILSRRLDGAASANVERRHPQRTVQLHVRFSALELAGVRRRAEAAGVPYARYVRETCLGRRPRSKPQPVLLLQTFLRETAAIASNLRQIDAQFPLKVYGRAAAYVGGELPKAVYRRPEALPIIEAQLDAINGAGVLINGIARRANMDKRPTGADVAMAMDGLRTAFGPLARFTEGKLPPPPQRRFRGKRYDGWQSKGRRSS